MHTKNILVFVILLCSVFQCAFSTGLLFNAIKNTVKSTRCKLHNLGSKIIHHDHHADPCSQQEVSSGHHHHHEFGSINGYHGNEHEHGGHESQENYYENTYGNGYNQPDLFNGPEHNGLEITTPPSVVSKDTSTEKNSNPDSNGSNIFINLPVDNSLGQDVNNGNAKSSTERPKNEDKSIEENMEEIFGKPTISNEGVDVTTDNNKNNGVTTEINPLDVDIDIRSGNKLRQSAKSEQFVTVPPGGGRHIIKVNCPNGMTPTKDGECLEEF